MDAARSDSELVKRIEQLIADGLKTQWSERAYSAETVNRLVAELQKIAPEDLSEKIDLAGFTMEPFVSGEGEEAMEQACETCMYYVVHRGFCDLPELKLPVKPKWSCRLWRI